MLLKALECLIADIMLDLACIRFGVIVTYADALEEIGQNFVACVGVAGDFGSLICQRDIAVGIHMDETFFAKLFHCYTDAGL